MLKFYWGGLMVGRIIGIFVLRKFKASQILTLCALGGALMLGASLVLVETLQCGYSLEQVYSIL